ncbi:MAG: ABC transporter permease [Lachnospiraceae bacterium]|nr:ABC transporter permease [Lachnospiraceae bacterium]
MKYITRKFVTLIITLLLISAMTFGAFSVIPGDASVSRLGTEATQEQIEALREEMGLNRPITERYASWVFDAIHGDFGESLRYSGITVQELLEDRLPVTVLLAVIALIMMFAFSVPLALLSVRFRNRWQDTVISQLVQVVMAIPSFFLGILLTYLFGIALHMFQPGKFISPSEDFWASVRYLIFPAMAIALPKGAMVIRFIRNAVLGEMKKEYVRTARSKGNGKDRILYVHVLRNALIPVITFGAMIAAQVLAGSIIVEQVFSVPGVGRLLVSSISARDYPVVQAIVIYITAIVVIMNFAVDVLYQIADPRVKGDQG